LGQHAGYAQLAYSWVLGGLGTVPRASFKWYALVVFSHLKRVCPLGNGSVSPSPYLQGSG